MNRSDASIDNHPDQSGETNNPETLLDEADWQQSLPDRLRSQLRFLVAIDALKSVNRACRIHDGSRRENSAEHSWHLCLFARILAEYAEDDVDADRAVTMLLIHDIVEIDAGDTPLHGPQNPDKHALEAAAAARLFGLLPEDQSTDLLACWNEFEEGKSSDARFAKAVDRLQPIMLNMLNQGGTWQDFNVTLKQVLDRTSGIKHGSETLWQCATAMFDEARRLGWLKTDPPTD